MNKDLINPVGVFDSGVGGLSLLRCMREELPAGSDRISGKEAAGDPA